PRAPPPGAGPGGGGPPAASGSNASDSERTCGPSPYSASATSRHGGGNAAPENDDASPRSPGSRYELEGRKMNARAAKTAAVRDRVITRVARKRAAGPSA